MGGKWLELLKQIAPGATRVITNDVLRPAWLPGGAHGFLLARMTPKLILLRYTAVFRLQPDRLRGAAILEQGPSSWTKEYVERRENIIAIGNSGTGKSHIALGLGLAACQKGLSVGFTTAAAIVHELIEARDEKLLLCLQRQLADHKLLLAQSK